jgi:hypothetical protein
MNLGASFVWTHGRRLGMLAAVVLLAAASVPGESSGRDRVRAQPAQRARAVARPAALVVAVGATGGDLRARQLLTDTMSAWISQQPRLQLQGEAGGAASLVLTANVRALTVHRDAAGTLARCDLGIVVADARGAVRGMLDARRTVRSGHDAREETVAAIALRSAVDGALRGLLSEVVPNVVW